MRISLALLFIGLLLTSSCNSEPRESHEETDQVLPDDFIVFLDQFHSNPEFQIEHIRFPLQGIPAMMDSSYVQGEYYWQKDDWVIHQAFDTENDEFEQVFTVFDENMIIERILHINRTMGMERRFAKTSDGWNLIYYAGMNFIRQDN